LLFRATPALLSPTVAAVARLIGQRNWLIGQRYQRARRRRLRACLSHELFFHFFPTPQLRCSIPADSEPVRTAARWGLKKKKKIKKQMSIEHPMPEALFRRCLGAV
jgi:hypothetical protein